MKAVMTWSALCALLLLGALWLSSQGRQTQSLILTAGCFVVTGGLMIRAMRGSR